MDLEVKKSFLRIAKEIASRSKCISYKVGCVIVLDGRIISTGFNGTPSGYKNCCDMTFKDREEHKIWSDHYEIHSEMNAILIAAKKGVAIENSVLFSTLQPCWTCTKNIVPAGIKAIYFAQIYDRICEEDDKKIREFVKDNNIIYELVELEQK